MSIKEANDRPAANLAQSEPWIIEVSGTRWLVRQAVSQAAALNAITFARMRGAIGHRDIINRRYDGGGEEVLADVVRVNSDGTECVPYCEVY